MPIETNELPVGTTTPPAAGEDNGKKPVNNEPESIPYSKFRELLDEKKRLQAQYVEVRSEHDKMLSERESQEKQKLEEQKKFEELYKKADQDRKKLLDLLEVQNKKFTNEKKLGAFKEKLGGLKRDDYTRFVDLDKIQTRDDGTVDHDALDAYVNEFRVQFPELVVENKKTPPPSTAPRSAAPIGSSGGRMSLDDITAQYARELREKSSIFK
jgi:hypothetical protein